MIGMCRKAGKAVLGSEGAENAVRGGRAVLVVLAGDASAGVSKRIRDKCASYGVPLIAASDKESLGAAAGMAGLSAIAVTDVHFASGIRDAHRQSQECGEIYGGVYND